MKSIENKSIGYGIDLPEQIQKKSVNHLEPYHPEASVAADTQKPHWTGSTQYRINRNISNPVVDREPRIRTEMTEPEENIMPYVLLTAFGLLLMTALGPLSF